MTSPECFIIILSYIATSGTSRHKGIKMELLCLRDFTLSSRFTTTNNATNYNTNIYVLNYSLLNIQTLKLLTR